MRILLVAFSYPPIANTGSRRVAGLAAHLVRLGHDVRVLTGSVPGADRPAEEDRMPVLHTRWIGPPLPADWTEPAGARPAGAARASLAGRVRVAARAVHVLYVDERVARGPRWSCTGQWERAEGT